MYNKTYNTRNSGRFNNPIKFEPAGGAEALAAQQYQSTQQSQVNQQQQLQHQQQTPMTPHRHSMQQQANLLEVPLQTEDEEMLENQDGDDSNVSIKQEDRPAWMKSKLSGVKKISNKERRRRQNETLRRLLTPKNGLMVLNEMMPNEQIANHFKVEAAQNQFYSRNTHTFCADLTLEGNNYKGYGDNKLSARNSAAEQAIRDLIIKKMNKVVSTIETGGAEEADEEALPMIQLASFALHKLFTEWEYDGHKVPQLRPAGSAAGSAAGSVAGSVAGSAAGSAPEQPAAAEEAPAAMEAEEAPRKKAKGAKKPRTLPLNAGAMHPCMLLAYMRPRLDYRELAVQGDKPQNMQFTMGVDVDGATYLGKAANKKEARKAAARAACTALFGTQFENGASATAPLH